MNYIFILKIENNAKTIAMTIAKKIIKLIAIAKMKKISKKIVEMFPKVILKLIAKLIAKPVATFGSFVETTFEISQPSKPTTSTISFCACVTQFNFCSVVTLICVK